MATFAERMGAKPVRSVSQVDDLDDETRTALWNVAHQAREAFDKQERFWRVGHAELVGTSIWRWHYKLPLDTFTVTQVWKRIRSSILGGDVIDCLGTVEALAQNIDPDKKHSNLQESLLEAFNGTLSANLVGYRFIEDELVKVGSDEEAESIEQAIASTAALGGAQTALRSAVTLMSDREHPNYPKSLAESIHAVEAIVRHMTGSGTLGDGLQRLEERGFQLHPALKGAWLKMYGYASDEHGVRHGSIKDSEVDEKMASYFLVTCSAFVNLLLKFEAESQSKRE